MHKMPMKSDVSLSAHLLPSTSLASPKKNSKSYQDQNCILTFIVWVAKGHWVLIVQKQDGNNVLAIGAPMTSLLIYRRGELCAVVALGLVIAVLIFTSEAGHPVLCGRLMLNGQSKGAMLSHNLKDSDTKKVLWCLTYRASKCHRPKQAPISNNSGPLKGFDIQNWWALVPRACSDLASPRPLGNLSGPGVKPWEPSSI